MVEYYSGHNNQLAQGQSLHAREAAEALFKPKQSVKPPQATAAPNRTSDQHKPRILAALPEGAAFKQAPAGASPGKIKPLVLELEIPKIRTWIRYGMTLAQVAHVYGISAAEVKRALDAR